MSDFVLAEMRKRVAAMLAQLETVPEDIRTKIVAAFGVGLGDEFAGGPERQRFYFQNTREAVLALCPTREVRQKVAAVWDFIIETRLIVAKEKA